MMTMMNANTIDGKIWNQAKACLSKLNETQLARPAIRSTYFRKGVSMHNDWLKSGLAYAKDGASMAIYF